MSLYQIGVGCSGVVSEYHRIHAENRIAARMIGMAKFMGKGHDYVVVIPVTQNEIAQEARIKRMIERKIPPRA